MPRLLGVCFLWLLVCFLVPSRFCWSADPGSSPSVVRDLRLSSRGSLDGLMVDRMGLPVVGQRVVLSWGGRAVAEVRTDREGRFSFGTLRSGVCEVAAAGHRGVYRVWSADVAPPSSREGLLVVGESTQYRGQFDGNRWFSRQSVISAAMLGGAVLVPVIVVGQRDSAS